MIEKINPTIPIPIESSSIPDEQRVITIAKSNIAIPNPIFFTVNPYFENSDWTKSLRDGLRRLWRSFLFNLKKAVDNES